MVSRGTKSVVSEFKENPSCLKGQFPQTMLTPNTEKNILTNLLCYPCTIESGIHSLNVNQKNSSNNNQNLYTGQFNHCNLGTVPLNWNVERRPGHVGGAGPEAGGEAVALL